MKTIALVACGVVVLAAGAASAQQPGAAAPQQQREQRPPDPRSRGGGDCRDNPYNCADAPNPIPAPNTVWMEEMTWMDVRDAMKAGKTSVIIASGGMEPNGPWLATGKHNYVLHANCEAIARKMGNALCAPIVKFVPEGDIGRVKVDQPARIYLDSNPNQPLDAYVSRIDPEATFTPENTYFRDERVKQVVGVKLQLKAGTGFAKPGMPADGEILVQGNEWPSRTRQK